MATLQSSRKSIPHVPAAETARERFERTHEGLNAELQNELDFLFECLVVIGITRGQTFKKRTMYVLSAVTRRGRCVYVCIYIYIYNIHIYR